MGSIGVFTAKERKFHHFFQTLELFSFLSLQERAFGMRSEMRSRLQGRF